VRLLATDSSYLTNVTALEGGGKPEKKIDSSYFTNVSVFVGEKKSEKELNPIEVEITIDENAATGVVILPVEQAQSLKNGDLLIVQYNDDDYYFVVTGFSSNFSLTDYYRGVFLVGTSSIYMNTRVQFPGTIPQQVSLFDNISALLQYVFLGGRLKLDENALKSAFEDNMGKIITESTTARQLVIKMLDFLEKTNAVVEKLHTSSGYRPPDDYIYGGKQNIPRFVLTNAFLRAVIYNGFPDSVMAVRDFINYILQPIMYKMVCNGTVSWRLLDIRAFVPNIEAKDIQFEEVTIQSHEIERIERSYNAMHPSRSMAYMTLDDTNSTAMLYNAIVYTAQENNKADQAKSPIEQLVAGVEPTEHEKKFGTNVGPEAIVPVPFDSVALLSKQYDKFQNQDDAIKDLKNQLSAQSSDMAQLLRDVAAVRWYELARGASTMRVTGRFHKEILPGKKLVVVVNNNLKYSGQVYSSKFYWRADGQSYAQYELVGVRTEAEQQTKK
jgi:hypothetical protein